MSVEVYSLSVDFSGNLNRTQFHQEIVDNGTLPTLVGVHDTEDIINIEFDSSLNAGQQTTLNGLVSSHIPSTIPKILLTETILPKKDTYSNTSYTRAASYIYNPTINTLYCVKVLSYMDTGITSYDLQLFDKTHGNIIVTKNSTNTDEELVDVGTLTNMPTVESILELNVKRTGGKKNNNVYLESIGFYFI